MMMMVCGVCLKLIWIRGYKERDRGETRKEIYFGIVFFFLLIPIVEKGLEGDLIQKDKFIRERYRKHCWPSCFWQKTWLDMTTLYMSPMSQIWKWSYMNLKSIEVSLFWISTKLFNKLHYSLFVLFLV